MSFILSNPGDPKSNITVIIRDITEKDKVNKALEISNARLQELFNNAHDLILVTSIDGSFKFVNQSWVDLIEYTRDELRNISFIDLVHPDYKAHTESFLKHLGLSETSGKLETILGSKERPQYFPIR